MENCKKHALHFLRFGKIVELVKFPDPIMPMTPFFPSNDLFVTRLPSKSTRDQDPPTAGFPAMIFESLLYTCMI